MTDDRDFAADWKATMEAIARKLTEPRQPLGPLIAPAWLPDLAAAEGYDLDALAREYGFDGYVLPDFKRCVPIDCEPGNVSRPPNRAERRARR